MHINKDKQNIKYYIHYFCVTT